MRRTVSLALGLTLLLGSAVPVLAGKPALNCPADPSGHAMVTVDGWWANTVDGFEAEGIAVYVGGNPANAFTAEFDAFAAAVGFADGQAFYGFIVGAQWDTINKNGDAYVCMKSYPRTPGNPAYLFTGTDNNAT